MNPTLPERIAFAAALALGSAPGAVLAQATQKVSPPLAQAWIDVATHGGMGMSMGGPAGGAANPMAAIGSLFGRGGGGAAQNEFGHTVSGGSGRWVDVTLSTRQNPQLTEAQQAVPAGFLSPALKLQSPPQAKPAPERDDEVEDAQPTERPKGRILLYWGCGSSIRAGQPRVLDAATASPADFARFFQGRRATQRGAHLAAGRPVWPSKADARMVPAGATLVGEHAFSGQGVPEGFRFQIPAAQDLMPALQLQQADAGGATELRWTAAPTARAYFAAAMGAADNQDMVIWTSSELPDTGFGLVDYQPNAAIDRWLKEKVLLAPGTTQCTVPKGVFTGQGAMLRLIGYGSELQLAHPPRPSDPKQPWNPEWAVRLRVKTMDTAMLGMPDMGAMQGRGSEQAPAEEKEKRDKPKALDVLKGILGR